MKIINNKNNFNSCIDKQVSPRGVQMSMGGGVHQTDQQTLKNLNVTELVSVMDYSSVQVDFYIAY